MELFIIYFLVGGLICAGVGGYIAGEKNRNAVAWAIVCFFLNIIGLIGLVRAAYLVNLLDKEFWKTAKMRIVKASIKQGVDLNTRDENELTPLHLAVLISEMPEVVALLIDSGADIEARDKNANTPLHNAARNGKLEMVTLLLDKGADIEARERNGNTLLYNLVSCDEKPEMVTLLLRKGADIDARGRNGNTLLYNFMSCEKPELVALLLDRGADIERRDGNGNTPLHWAVSFEKTEMTALLLDRGANKEVHDREGNTPLHRAVSYKKKGMDALLLDKGADIEARDGNGNTPLYEAVSFEKTDMAALLLDRGADKEAHDREGNTPLHRAVSFEKTEMAALLLDRRADIEARDEGGNTPLQLAKEGVYKGKDWEEHVKSVANESLVIFSKIADAAQSELDDTPTRSRFSPFADSNIFLEAIKLRGIMQASRIGYRKLAREPAIARVVAKGEDGEEKIYYICRATPVRIKCADNIRLASYHAPVGRLASLPVDGWYRIEGNRIFQVIEKAEFQPLKDAEGWDSKDTVFESKVCNLITIESLRAFLRDANYERAKRFIKGKLRGIRDKMKLPDQFILDQYQDELFRLPLDSRILLLGAPGTGKTTTLIRRLSQKLDIEFLSDNEKRIAGINNSETESNYSESWIMFTPTDFLRLYVKDAFNREGISAPDERISTWDEFRIDIACNRFGVLRSASGRGSYVMKETSPILKDGLKTDLIAWFEDFNQWQKTIFLEKMRNYAKKISNEQSSSDISQLGKKLLTILGIDNTELQPNIFTSLLTEREQIQEFIKDIKKSSDKKTRQALKQFVDPVRSYINSTPKRYGHFRNKRKSEGRWYCAEGFSPTDIHPLEVDIVLLAIIREANRLITSAPALNKPNNPAYKTLEKMQNLYRTQVLVDEVSDFSPIQLSCMMGIAHTGVKSFFACGDFHQRVTNWGTNSIEQMKWAIPSIDAREVHVPYRQSRQLHNFAEQIILMSGGDIANAVLPKYENNEGVRPVLATQMPEVSEIANWLSQRIQEIEEQLAGLPSIAVLVNNEKDVQSVATALKDALAEQNIRVVPCLNGLVHGPDNAIRVFNVEYIKGLEFEAVFFVGIDKLAENQPDLFSKYLYVGATRAATYLGITCDHDIPPMIENLRESFGEDWRIDNKKKVALEKGCNNNGNRPLQLAASSEKPEIVELLLNKGADTEVRDESGETLLHWAAKKEILEVVELLIEKGADKEARDGNGNTPLQNAARSNNMEMLEFLLDREANIEARDEDGNRPLQLAIRRENMEMLEFLLNRKANIEARDEDGNTPLQLAVKSKTPKIVALLLDKGAEVNARNFNKNTPLHNVILNRNISPLEQDTLVEVLLKKGANTNIQNDQGKTPFGLFKENYDLKNRKAYWQLFSAELNKRDKNDKGLFDNYLGSFISMSYLDSRCSEKKNRASQKTRWKGLQKRRMNKLLESKLWVGAKIEDVTKVFDEGGDIDAPDGNGWTPLHWAVVHSKRPEIVSLLLDRRADIEARDNNGCTPLHMAVHSKRPEIVSLLLDKGADIEACDKNGCTPIHVAVKSKTVQIIALLLDKRANIEARNENELTPLHFSVLACENLEIVSLLLGRGAYLRARDENGHTPLHLVASNGKPKVISLLLDRGAELEAPAENGETPLHLAASSNTPAVVVTLLDRKANIEARDKDGWTPLHSAVRNEKMEMVALLLDRKANIEARDKDGWTPLHSAARFNKTPEVVSLLLDRGAKTNVQDKNRHTPYDRAKENKYLQVDGVIKRLEVANSELSLYRSPDDITDETEGMLPDFQKKQSKSVILSNLPAEFDQMKEYTTKRSISAVPSTKGFIRPVLQWASRQPEEFSRQEVADAMADHFDLSAEARKEQTIGGIIRLHSNTNWAISHLKHAELLRQTDDGNYEITDAGRKEAFSSNEMMTISYLMDKFPVYRIGRE